MGFVWTHVSPARWDKAKARIIGGAPPGVFDSRLRSLREGDLVPGDWWAVSDGARTLGYGWMDVCWGDAEILLAVDTEARRSGVGAFILERLHEEAHKRGLNYLTNIVRPTHPEGAQVAAWLKAHGFQASEDGRLHCAVVHAQRKR